MKFVAEGHSAYFQRQLGAGNVNSGVLSALCKAPLQTDTIAQLLSNHSARKARAYLLMALMERDLSGLASLQEICEAITTFAELTCQASVSRLAQGMLEDYGLPVDQEGRVQDLLILGMGKAGAHELNVSSDLDVIFVYRDGGETSGGRRGKISAAEFFHQLARDVVKDLSQVTEEGFVFRVDTRLRPNGDSGPLCVSLPMLEQYFFVQGREWERFAWLKARLIAQSGLAISNGQQELLARDEKDLASLVKPFVFRRYIDYRVFDGLRKLHETIRQEANKRDLRAPGSLDVKLGEGGIREIEFIAQVFQVVRGGRDADLTHRGTLKTLEALAAKHIIEAEQAERLQRAYVFLRRLEHALQYQDDQQTHRLPAPGPSRDAIGAMLLLGPKDFEIALQAHMSSVKQVFQRLLSNDREEGPSGSTGSNSPLEEKSANRPGLAPSLDTQQLTLKAKSKDGTLANQLTGFFLGAKYRSAQSETQQQIIQLLSAAFETSSVSACERLLAFVEVVVRRPSYLALLSRFPKAFAKILELLDKSSWAADYLNKHPLVLDELLDGRLLEAPLLDTWQTETENRLAQLGSDQEAQMELLREAQHALVFRFLVQDLSGLWTIEQLSDQLSEIADRVLAISLPLVWQQCGKAFREVPQFAVIAYGKLGGKELGYASDLDLVFLYDDTDDRAQEAYSQLAQRLSTWLSSTTRAGILYEIDLRLRPNGNAGLLVSSLQGYERYQQEKAWTWELQALTRARFSAGDPQIGQHFETFRRRLLSQKRDLGVLGQEVHEMRLKMLQGHPNRSELFDLKHDPGGMVDIEFITQYLVLAHAHAHPRLLENLGNIALLGISAQLGLIPKELGTQVIEAYRKFRAQQHSLRLNEANFARTRNENIVSEISAVRRLYQQVLSAMPA